MLKPEYVKFEWRGSKEVKNGIAVFYVFNCQPVEIEMTDFGTANKIYERMQKIAEMAYSGGQEDIKFKVTNL